MAEISFLTIRSPPTHSSGPLASADRSPRASSQLPRRRKIDISPFMESKFGCHEQKIVVLQDHKRLPARFFACVSGALNSRLS